MGNTVGILALKALYNPSNIGQITNQVKRDIEKIEQQAGEIDLKVKAPDMSEFQDRIVRASDSIQNLQKRKLKGFNLSDVMGGLFGTFADPNKNAKDYAEEMENTLKKLKLITQVPDYELMRDFTSKELNAVLRRQEQLEFEKQVKNNSRQAAQENVDKIKSQKTSEIVNSFNDDESKIYEKYKSKKNVDQLSQKMGLDFKSLDKEAQDTFGKYARLSQIQDILKNRQKDISKLDTSDDILNEIQNYKNLEYINELLKKTGETLQGLGATNLPEIESFNKQIFDATKRYRDLLSQEAKTDDEIQKIEQERDKYIIDTYKKRSKKTREVEDAKLEESEKNFQKKYSSDNDSKDTKKDTSFTSNTSTKSDVKPSVNKDIWKQAFEDVKKDYLSYAKYAVDEETALQELNRLSETFKNDENYFNKDDLKDFNGYIQSLKNWGISEDSLPDNIKKILNSNDYKDTLDLWKDSVDIPKLQDQISKMFDAQKSAYDKLYKESTPDDNIERKLHGNESYTDRSGNNTYQRDDFDDIDNIEYNENISRMAQDANELYQYISNINSIIPELSSGLEGLSNNSFTDLITDLQKIEESSKSIISQIEKYKTDIDRISPEKTKNKSISDQETKKPKYTVSKESPKIKKNIKDLISEDSNGQMYITDAKPSKQIIDSQNDIQSSIKETNQQIKGQINLFDDLGDKKRASSKLDHENKPNTDQLNKSADPSSEIAGMQQLSQAVNQVTSAVERKTLAFIDEEDVVGQVSNLESSSMQSLSKSIDKVTDAVEKRNLKLLEGEEYSSQIADIEIENQKKIQNAIGDTSKEKQKIIDKDKKNIENNNSNSSSSNSRNSNKSRKPNSSNKETTNIPSTYVRNIDTAYDQALKINKIIDQADQLKNNLMFDGLDSGDGFKDRLDSVTKYLKESSKIDIRYAENEINKVRALQEGLSFKEMLTDPMSNLNVSQMPSVVNNISSQIDELNSQLDSGSISVNKYNSELEKLQNRMSRADDYANSASEAIDKMNKKAMEAFGGKGKITQEPTKYDKNGKRIETVTASYDGDVFKQSWQEADNIIEHTTKTTKQSTSLIGNFFDGLKQRWTSLGQYLLSFGSFYEVFDILKQGFGIITDLDDALTEMNKVSDMPLAKLQDFQKESFNIADGIGSTGLQIQQSTADFLRLGESFNEAQKSAEAANVLYNVSEFESIDAATESLIAMSAAYQDLDKMEINDKLNNVGNNFSISTDGLATALQKSASALTTAGADIDKSIALITAGNAVVQDPDSVGAGIRTIALRLMGTEEAKKELEETGEDTSDFIVQTASKINDQFKAFTAVASNDWKGISILDDNGNNRDPYEILQDVADIYKEIVATDKQFGTNHLNALLELMAGKQRANIAASIIQNPNTLREAYEASLSSEGSALEENQKHLDSISGHLDQLKNKWQEVWSGTGRDVVNPILDIASGILDIVNNIGLLQTALMGVAAFFGAKSMLSKDGLLPNLLG